MVDSVFLAQLLINGLVLGAVYALLSAGLSVIFGVLGIANIAHGELYMLGAYSVFFLTQVVEIDFWPSLPLAAILLAAFGVILYKLLLARTEGDESLERGLLVTVGLSMILQNGVIYLWTAQPRTVYTAYDLTSLEFFGLRLSFLRVLILVVGAVAFLGLTLLFTRTNIGRAMRAITQNRDAALAVGINPGLISVVTVALGAALAGLAGAAIAPIWGLNPSMGLPILFKSFAIIIIGGLGSIPGAVIAALIIGIVESFSGGFGSIVIQDSIAFLLMILLLFIRPQGILGRRVRI